MFGKIAAFEFRYQLRQPAFWVIAIVFGLLAFGSVAASDNISIGSGGNVHKNAPFAIAQVAIIMSVFYMFVSTAFVANVIVRDDETGFGPIVRATRITRIVRLEPAAASTMVSKPGRVVNTSAAARQASAPPWTAIPTFAAAMAAASFTPSPTMKTRCPAARRLAIVARLASGLAPPVALKNGTPSSRTTESTTRGSSPESTSS